MKRMLVVSPDNDVYINSSSADVIQTCRRKAYYQLHLGVRAESEDSTALLFGSAIHKAMEAFYRTVPNARRLEDSVDAFRDYASATKLIELPAEDKRSISNGIKIVEKYHATYKDDPWVAVVDANGPVVERSFELPVDPYRWLYIHGQIDCLLKNVETGEVVVCDHKTSSSLGTDFMNRIKPNLQFSTYAWAARQMGFEVNRVMVNGIQVAKTKTDLVRVFTERTKEDFNEMIQTYLDSTDLYFKARKDEKWPLNSTACSHWGGCQYREVCSLPVAQRKNALEILAGRPLQFEQQ